MMSVSQAMFYGRRKPSDVLTAEIDGISIRIQRTLTGQDNEDVKTTR